VVAATETFFPAVVDDIIGLLLRGYLLLPLAGFYAFPKRQSLWLVPIFAAPIAAELWGSRSESELVPLAFISAMLLAIAAPVALLVHAVWRSRLRKFIIVALVVLLGYFVLYTSAIYRGEAYLNPDDYCWKAEIALGPCAPSPWLLAPIAVGLPAMMLVVVGSIPMAVALLWYGWKRRKAERIARSA
jgi:hypothetical protein